MAADNFRNNIKLQNEYLAKKESIEEQYRCGDIKPIRRMYAIDEKDLRPSVEQTPYMVSRGIPDHVDLP